MKTVVWKSLKSSIWMFLTVLLLFSACGPTTEITGVWKNPKTSSSGYKSIFIMAMTDNVAAMQTLETDLNLFLRKHGLKKVGKSADLFPPSFGGLKTSDKDAIINKVRANGYEAILTVTIQDKETESRYVPGTMGYTPVTRFGYYGLFGGYYTTMAPTYSPGYYVQEKVYFIESNLYETKNEELVWSAQSETYNPTSIQSFSKGFAAVVINKMTKDRLITPAGK